MNNSYNQDLEQRILDEVKPDLVRDYVQNYQPTAKETLYHILTKTRDSMYEGAVNALNATKESVHTTSEFLLGTASGIAQGLVLPTIIRKNYERKIAERNGSLGSKTRKRHHHTKWQETTPWSDETPYDMGVGTGIFATIFSGVIGTQIVNATWPGALSNAHADLLYIPFIASSVYEMGRYAVTKTYTSTRDWFSRKQEETRQERVRRHNALEETTKAILQEHPDEVIAQIQQQTIDERLRRELLETQLKTELAHHDAILKATQ